MFVATKAGLMMRSPPIAPPLPWPRSTAGASQLGRLLKEVGQLEQALDCFRRAIALDPNFVRRIPPPDRASGALQAHRSRNAQPPGAATPTDHPGLQLNLGTLLMRSPQG